MYAKRRHALLDRTASRAGLWNDAFAAMLPVGMSLSIGILGYCNLEAESGTLIATGFTLCSGRPFPITAADVSAALVHRLLHRFHADCCILVGSSS